MSKISKILLKSKFRGAMLGTLVGDCCGAPFDGEAVTLGSKIVIQKYFDKLEGQYFKAPVKKHTEDSSMTKCVAQYLIANPTKLESQSLAKALVKEFYTNPRRGYGENVIQIFSELRANKFSDVFKPAQEQYNFAESSDNGAAMRMSPIAMFCYNNYTKMVELARTSIEITHTHREGVTGGLVQSAAVQQSLNMDPKDKIDIIEYSNSLIEKVQEFEKDEEGLGIDHSKPFTNQLEIIRNLLSKNNVSDGEVVNKLGHSMSARYSVPTAIYCFLRACSEIDGIQSASPFRRTIQYAISLGGDTDTIASMAGSISGAYYGEEQISKTLLRHCEASETFISLADSLYQIKCNT